MKAWIPVVALLCAATLMVGFSIGPIEALAQRQLRPSTPPSPPPPPPRSPPRPPVETPRRPAKHVSATGPFFWSSHLAAERSAHVDSALTSAERVLELTRRMSPRVSELGTPQTFQNLGLRSEQAQLYLYAMARPLRALHEEWDDPEFLREVGPNRMRASDEVLDGLERALKEADRLQRSLEKTVLR